MRPQQMFMGGCALLSNYFGVKKVKQPLVLAADTSYNKSSPTNSNEGDQMSFLTTNNSSLMNDVTTLFKH